jgi:hypothetical protein
VESEGRRRFPTSYLLEKGDRRPWVARLSRVDRVRAQIDELFASDQPLAAAILEQVACLSIRRWQTRRLAEVELECLYLDASHFLMHPGARAEPVLAAWGITGDGKPVFPHSL